MEEFEKLNNEEQEKLFLISVTTENGENGILSYGEGGNFVYSFPIRQSGNYSFKATNGNGRSSEIVVPMEIDESQIKTFTLEVSETETKTFLFIEGQTWEEFTGNNSIIMTNQKVFKKEQNGIRCFNEDGSESGFISIEGENGFRWVKPTDKIDENVKYLLPVR